MKSIQKRLYTVLPRGTPTSSPRARSNSVSSTPRTLYTSSTGPVLPLSFFDSPPPPLPSSRPILSSNRLPAEPKPTELEGPPNSNNSSHHSQSGGHPPFSLALTAPPSNSSHTLVPGSPNQYSLFPYTSLAGAAHGVHPSAAPPTTDAHPRAKRQRLRYHLDVGAYGIAKARPLRSRHQGIQEDLNLAVQVGEDAYFVRDNAMGVADGVGGWTRVKGRGEDKHPTPSALFARRLMHFCSAEVEAAHTPPPPPRPRSPAQPISLKPRPSPLLSSSTTPWYWTDPTPSSFEYDEYALESELENELEELEEGIDVLQILERAYDQTIKAHVVPGEQENGSATNTDHEPKPLMAGSSTALVAVLDHPPRVSESSVSQPPSLSSPSTSSPSPAPTINYAAGLLPQPDFYSASPGARIYDPTPSNSDPNLTSDGPSIECTVSPASEYDAVIKIAHVGDCMGMLVRGDEMVWRSEEMWWNFNTPVQLGPTTPTTPRTAAHTFTLPVKADDILILASDGLSDNLWDEDVLDEVVRFRRGYLDEQCAASTSGSSATSSRSDKGPLESNKGVSSAAEQLLKRRTLAGMLSEALCSRARRVSERRGVSTRSTSSSLSSSPIVSSPLASSIPISSCLSSKASLSTSSASSATTTPPISVTSATSSASTAQIDAYEDEVPFARRAREVGKVFRGGKNDDISVIVAVISPAEV
ncbi:hypothetical protein BDQ12DRAFT_266453 [Crucibulum laeve]|uniref:Protein phosphatase n=1 Tax=Crucibulum laeve TaxID=68775 RepID=A0A5C3LRP8_9AGAR|nr:hypothetical protein BDQ12DRAFT_266453 [Crucibulum laeve]